MIFLANTMDPSDDGYLDEDTAYALEEMGVLHERSPLEEIRLAIEAHIVKFKAEQGD